MSKTSKFVLVTPESFYIQRVTYTCTRCAQSFSLDVESAPTELQRLEQTHDCRAPKQKMNVSSSPLLKLLRDHSANSK